MSELLQLSRAVPARTASAVLSEPSQVQAHPLSFNEIVRQSPRRLAMPIAVYPGLALTGASVRDVVTRPQAQVEAQAALHERYRTPFLLSAMDLSVEAEAFGCALHLADNEIPSVTGRLVTNLEEARKLAAPRSGDKRTAVYLEAVRQLCRRYADNLVLAGCIGPFSLAARLVGVSEALELTLTEPELMQAVLEKSTQFLVEYVRAFRAAGAEGIIMAEPAAGLLSPRGLATFSSAYIRQIAAALKPERRSPTRREDARLEDSRFTIILHNCAAKLPHLPAILETGLKTFHFGAPMDIAAALGRAPSEVVLCGNLDPVGVFVQQTPEEVAGRTRGLLAATASYRNFVISSGCNVPPTAPLASLDAFFQTVSGDIAQR